MNDKRKTYTPEELEAIRERFAMYYADTLHITKREFERNLGKALGYINSYSGNPKREAVKAFSQVYPALNLDWVHTGLGSMINPGYENKAMEIHPIKKAKYVDEGEINVSEIKEVNKEDTILMLKTLVDNLIEDNSRKQKTIERLMDMLTKVTQEMG